MLTFFIILVVFFIVYVYSDSSESKKGSKINVEKKYKSNAGVGSHEYSNKNNIPLPKDKYPVDLDSLLALDDYSVSGQCSHPALDEFLDVRQKEIKKIVEDRKVEYLIHFTRYENLQGIMNNGLVSRKTLDDLTAVVVYNDELRLDGHLDSISLSVSFPNYKMFYKYRMKSKASGWVVLFLSPDILWKLNCAFYKSNAASSQMSSINVAGLKGADSFLSMFSDYVPGADSRILKKLTPCETTDPQAEVLVFESIPKKFILSIGFEDQELLMKSRQLYPLSDICFKLSGEYYQSRGYGR